ncbi:hypothetical protein CYPRO_0663 [Cyclonatronum proteinivorum]|uniref:DUF5683 domain-containing protein n=1 Tax=Cyclonatronum proteinivorum TaxID=1457365 RepID=A0A345UHJ5_9BACT|nr:DUF5683 domain-containing protein [Cyclonatronum proteinivorum]AXI99946.1 hypothetical protein CYPRO_0663 [Cyclonatronum proteinivorum]
MKIILSNIIIILLFIPELSSARQAVSLQNQTEGEREVKAVINPSNVNLFSYVAERDNALNLGYFQTSGNGFIPVMSLCRYTETVRDDIGREEEIITNKNCDDFNWRPVLDENGRYWFLFTSRSENRIYAGYVGKSLDCSTAEACNYFPLTISLPRGDGSLLRPQWAADGTAFIFEFGGNVFKVSGILSPEMMQEQELLPILFIENAAYPNWSHNQEFIAFERDGDILVFNYGLFLRDKSQDLYSVNQNLPADRAFEKSRPFWSSDGAHLSYFVPEITQSHNASEQEDNFSWNILIRSLITEGEDFGFRPLNRERFQVRGVSRARDTLTGPMVVNFLTGEDERVFTGFVNNDPDNNFPVILRSIRADGRQLSTTISDRNHFNNDYVAMMPSENTIRFIYSSQMDGELNLNFATWESQDHSFTAPYTFQNVGQRDALIRSALIPGYGQLFKGQQIKGYSLMAGAAVLTGAGIYFGLEAKNALDEYQRQLDAFRDLLVGNEATSAELMDVRRKRDLALDDQKRFNNLQTLSLTLLAAVYVYNLFDAQQGFPIYRRVSREGVKNRVTLNADLLTSQSGSVIYPGVQITLNGL